MDCQWILSGGCHSCSNYSTALSTEFIFKGRRPFLEPLLNQSDFPLHPGAGRMFDSLVDTGSESMKRDTADDNDERFLCELPPLERHF